MLRISKIALFFTLLVGFSSLSKHRFYAAIYQIDFVPKKEMIQITTRIFIDDLNDALKHKYNKRTFLGTDKESPEDVLLMKKYVSEQFKLRINGKFEEMNFLSKELENNVIVCYLNIKDIRKVSSVEVVNSILTELFPEQQNIIQYNNAGKKQNLLMTSEITKGMLN